MAKSRWILHHRKKSMVYKVSSISITWFQLFPRNSLITNAFCPYIKGEIQYPHIHQGLIFSVSLAKKQTLHKIPFK